VSWGGRRACACSSAANIWVGWCSWAWAAAAPAPGRCRAASRPARSSCARTRADTTPASGLADRGRAGGLGCPQRVCHAQSMVSQSCGPSCLEWLGVHSPGACLQPRAAYLRLRCPMSASAAPACARCPGQSSCSAAAWATTSTLTLLHSSRRGVHSPVACTPAGHWAGRCEVSNAGRR
jgi:hypothetical protein